MLKIFIKSITIIFVFTYMSSAHAGDAGGGREPWEQSLPLRDHRVRQGGRVRPRAGRVPRDAGGAR